MIRIETTIGGTTYRWSTESLDYGNVYYEPRVAATPDIQRVMQDSVLDGNRRRSVMIRLDNRDLALNTIQDTYGFLNRTFTIILDDGTNLTKKFVGVVNEIPSFGLDVELVLTEEINSWMDQPIPDAQFAEDYYSEFGVNESWNAIPIVFGNVTRLRVSWVSKIEHQFMVCSGEIFRINKVWLDKVVLYDRVAGTNGYQYKNGTSAVNLKVRIFKGSGWASAPEVVDTITSSYPGYCYLQFYDANNGNAICEPKLSDGTVPQIYVDLEGIVNTAGNAAERNPAEIIKKLLSNPSTCANDRPFAGGPNGYGLGCTATLDFADAITYCNTNGFMVDGVLDSRRNSQEWFDVLLKHFGGMLIEENGTIKCRYDKASTGVAAVFDETGESGYHVILDSWSEPPLDQQINRLKLSYYQDYEGGNFKKTPGTNEESPVAATNLINATHASRIAKWNTGSLDLPFFQTDIPAHRIAEMYFKKMNLQLKQISFHTEKDVETTLDVGQEIRMTAPRFGWLSKAFTILSITKGEGVTQITAKEYDANVYVYTGPGSETVISDKPYYSPYAIPGASCLNSATVSTGLTGDGNTLVTVALNSTPPSSNYYETIFYRKADGTPITSFEPFYSTQNGCGDFVWDGRAAGIYNIRAITKSPFGNESPLTSANEKNITIPVGDTTAPGQATISSSAITGGVKVDLGVTGGIPTDFGKFEIYRHINGAAATRVQDQWTSTTFVDTDPAIIGTTTACCVQYYARAIDRSGNCGSYSSTTTVVRPLIVPSGLSCVGLINNNALFAAGVIQGCNLVAGTIRTSEIYVAAPGAALNDDPNTKDITAWSLSSANATIETLTDGKVGTTTLRGNNGVHVYSRDIALDPAKTYRVRVWVRRSSTAPGGFYLRLYQYSAGGTGLLSSVGKEGITPGTTWEEHYALVTPNALTAYAQLGVVLNYNSPTGYHEVQDLRIEEAVPGTLISDGAIQTNHIYAKRLQSDNWNASLGSCFNLEYGTFKMGGNDNPKLAWNGSTLTVCGTVCSTLGNIAGWGIFPNSIYRAIGTMGIEMSSVQGCCTDGYGTWNGPHFATWNWDGSRYNAFSAGRYLFNGVTNQWDDIYGIRVVLGGCNYFAVHSNMDGSGKCAYIAGNDMGVNYLRSTNFALGSSGYCLDASSGIVYLSGVCITSCKCFTTPMIDLVGTSNSPSPMVRLMSNAFDTAPLLCISAGINKAIEVQSIQCCTANIYAGLHTALVVSTGNTWNHVGYVGTGRVGIVGHAQCRYGVLAHACCFALEATADSSYGIYSYAGTTYGIYGQSAGSYGVYGYAASYGTAGQSAYVGIYGYAYKCSGDTCGCVGVMGYAEHTCGVVGYALCCYGVFGCAPVYAVYACSTNNSAVRAVANCCLAVNAIAPYSAVYGYSSVCCFGVLGCAYTSWGVAGYAATVGGIYGKAGTCWGMYADSVAWPSFVATCGADIVGPVRYQLLAQGAVCLNAGCCLVNVSSDYRLKCNITPFSDVKNAYNIIMNLYPVLFQWDQSHWKSYNNGSRIEAGMLAQNVMASYPEAVALDADGYYMINYDKLIPLVIEGERNLYGCIEMLTTRLANIEERLKSCA